MHNIRLIYLYTNVVYEFSFLIRLYSLKEKKIKIKRILNLNRVYMRAILPELHLQNQEAVMKSFKV